MKWILCGKSDSAVECLRYLVAQGDTVWAIGNKNDDGVDGWQRSFTRAARELGVRCQQPPSINDPAFIDELRDFGADAFLSVQFDQILRDRLIDFVGCPCINLHFALLPRHRGVAPIAWAILEGDEVGGVTLHHMVEDIDAGDIVAQARFPIGIEDCARDVYEAAGRAAVDLFRSSYPFASSLLEQRLPQDAGAACYHREGALDFSMRRIDWTLPAPQLQRWIRAMIFPPLQLPETTVAGCTIYATHVAAPGLEPADAAPGTVLGVRGDLIEVATGRGRLHLRLGPGAGAADPSLTVGDVLE